MRISGTIGSDTILQRGLALMFQFYLLQIVAPIQIPAKQL
jgi:hypothetical protein